MGEFWGVAFFGVWIVAGAALYLTPLIVASVRDRLVAPVAVINIFLGWTLLGWVAALAMAVTRRSPEEERGRERDRELNREFAQRG